MSMRRSHKGLPRATAGRTLAGALWVLGILPLGLGACDGPEQLFPTGGGGSGGSGGAGGTGGGGVDPEAITPFSGGARRIIARQYVGSIRTLFGDQAAAVAKPPVDPQLLALETIAATTLATPPAFVDQYETSARDIAAAVMADPAAKGKAVPCTPTATDDAVCMRQVVEAVAPVAWRRPLTETEITRLVGVGLTGATAFGQFEMGARNVISAVLQSPHFLYIVEIGEPDPENPAVRRLTPAELVTRMSFFLINSTPPKVLLDAAAEGALNDEAGIRALAEQLVNQPEARASINAFYDEVYMLRNLATTPKDDALFPDFTPSVRAAMREETLRLVEDVVWVRDADAREVLDSDHTFVNGELATLYGYPGVTGDQWVKVTPPGEQGRAGFLTHGAFLARASHAESTSPTRRGAFILDTILCDPVPPPPPSVTPILPDDGTPKPVKKKLEQHMNNEGCKECHARMDPLGLALEPFDAIGRYRTEDVGFPIDPSGETPDLGAFSGPAEMASLLRNDDRAGNCIMKKLYRHSMGHLETKGERPAVIVLGQQFADSGYSLRSLLVDLTLSPAFRLVGNPK
jgi:PAS domain-containing protein